MNNVAHFTGSAQGIYNLFYNCQAESELFCAAAIVVDARLRIDV
jgi:hypothetical protein